jgi:predicted  nucleic acid-binding Zn-ribbon protein
MFQALKKILPIQEFDMQMIQLMRLKRGRQEELKNINEIKNEISQKAMTKEGEIIELKMNIRILEGEVKDVVDKIKKLESQQNQVKKVEEFNALSHEISQAERERVAKEQRLSDLYDKVTAEEEILNSLNENLKTTIEGSKILESEIKESIERINEEGRGIKDQRDVLVKDADSEIFRIYEMLLKNKKDRVIVPIENRCCSGCHIVLTAQHENLARKGERLVYCEHCSRIHYWQEGVESAGAADEEAKPRRRRRTTKAS